MTRPLCIYHANCADGFGAAWAVHRRFGTEVDFYWANYGNEPPDVTGRDVLVVDFSYPLPVLQAMAASARSVLVLDHHEGAKDALSNLLICDSSWDNWLRYGAYYNLIKMLTDAGAEEVRRALDTEHKSGRLATIFDMNRSGAGITWDFLHPNQPRPRLIDLVEDRDLWRFKHDPETRQFHAVAASYGYEVNGDLGEAFVWWDEWYCFADMVQNPGLGASAQPWHGILAEGAAILRAQDQLIYSIIKSSRRTMKIAGHVVPVACCPAALASEVGNRLCHGEREIESISAQPVFEMTDDQKASHMAPTVSLQFRRTIPPFSATYYDSKDKRHFSLRAPEGGADVNAIAKQFGGGGHVRASGFSRPLGWEGDTE